ncbi:MAG: hypothetical protein ABIP97_12130 [Chthoniobacterales bacterium]
MRTLNDIEAAIEQLPFEQLLHLQEWMLLHFKQEQRKNGFHNLDARLDHIAQKALAKFHARKTKVFSNNSHHKSPGSENA